MKHQIEVDVIPKIRQEFTSNSTKSNKGPTKRKRTEKRGKRKNNLNERREKQRTKRRW